MSLMVREIVYEKQARASWGLLGACKCFLGSYKEWVQIHQPLSTEAKHSNGSIFACSPLTQKSIIIYIYIYIHMCVYIYIYRESIIVTKL